MKSNKTVLTIAAVAILALAASAQATLLLYEPFDYPVGELLDGQTPPDGMGMTGSWTTWDAKGFGMKMADGPRATPGWRTWDGIADNIPQTGNFISVGADGRSHLRGMITMDSSVTDTFTDGSTTWMSCVSAQGDVPWGYWPMLAVGAGDLIEDRGNNAAGQAIGGGGDYHDNRDGLVGAYYWDDEDGNGSYEIHLSAATVPSTINVIPPIPHVWVFKITWSDTGNDTVEAYNFDVSSGAAAPTEAAFDAGAVSNSADLDQSLFTTLSYAGARVEYDEIRIGTTFDDVVTGTSIAPIASNPNPADKETDVPRDVVLSWTPGEGAISHNVYFGTDPNNWDQQSLGQSEASYDPGLLEFGTVYYWQVDEYDGTTTHTGDLWSFSAEPFAYPIKNITATASSSDAGQGPENTVNRSGLDANDLHSIELTDMWLSNAADANAAWIQYEFDKVYKLHQMWVWNHNTAFEVWVGFGFKDVTIEYSTNGTDWTVLAGATEFAQATGSPDYTHNMPVDFDGVVAKYVRITANSNWSAGLTTQYGLSEVRFLYIPVWAREPKPASGETDVALDDVVLNWRAGREAATHDVYLSRKRKAVVNGTANVGSVTEASYDAGTLDLGETYYWKINEVNEAETPTSWEGDVWSFATLEYFVVDDFEDYNDYEPDRIFETWKGGYGYTGYCGNGTGSVVGHATYPYAEQAIVYGGSQSMPVYYDNGGTGTNSCGEPINLYYSETERTFDTPQDWTKAGVRALTLYFQGDPDNDAGATEQMYLKVNGVKVVYDGDMADIKQAWWHEWNIDLASFSGVNLQNVNQITIGFGDENNTIPGGSGVVYFDDIRLYPSRCVLSKRSPDFARVDYVEDCVIDYKELDMMAENWLVAAIAPGDADLVAHYELDGDADDSSGNGNHGTVLGDPQWVTGYDGDALDFDGVDDYVVSSSTNLPAGPSSFTIAAWVFPNEHNDDIITWWGESGAQHRANGFRLMAGGQIRHYFWSNDYDITTGDLSGKWSHLALAHDGAGNRRFYLNGQQVIGSYTGATQAPDVLATNVYIGARAPDNTEYFNGVIDDVRIYNGVLTETEILYLAGLRGDLYEDNRIDLKDFAVLVDSWLDEDMFP